jgi:2,3-diketo-5-methylthio-1-phosphopentane phosphatase
MDQSQRDESGGSSENLLGVAARDLFHFLAHQKAFAAADAITSRDSRRGTWAVWNASLPGAIFGGHAFPLAWAQEALAEEEREEKFDSLIQSLDLWDESLAVARLAARTAAMSGTSLTFWLPRADNDSNNNIGNYSELGTSSVRWENALRRQGFDLAWSEPAMVRDAREHPPDLRAVAGSQFRKSGVGASSPLLSWELPSLDDDGGVLELSTVESATDIADFCRVLCAANGHTAATETQYRSALSALAQRGPVRGPTTLRSFVARLRDVPVGTVSGLWSPSSATLGVYDVSVLEQFRGRGIGRFLTEFCQHAFANIFGADDIRFVALTAADESVAARLYGPLHFSRVGVVDVFRVDLSRTPLTGASLGLDDDFVFVSDFDGTISTCDTLDCILDHHGPGGVAARLAVDERVEKGEINVLEGLQECFGRQGPRVSMEKAIETILAQSPEQCGLDPGFREVVTLARAAGIPVLVLSTGFRSVIHRLLPADVREHINLLCHDVDIDADGVWTVLVNDRAFDKGKVLQQIRQTGSRVIFFGDGLSDLGAAVHADIVFAKQALALHQHCIRENIPVVPFSNFSGALELLHCVRRRPDASTAHFAPDLSSGRIGFEAFLSAVQDVPVAYVGIGSFVRANSPRSRDQQLPGFISRSPGGAVCILLDPYFCGEETVPLVVRNASEWTRVTDNVWRRGSTLLATFPVVVGEHAEDGATTALGAFLDGRRSLTTVVGQFCVCYMAVPECRHIPQLCSRGEIGSGLIYCPLAAYATETQGTRVWCVEDSRVAQDEALHKEVARYGRPTDSGLSFGMASYQLVPGQKYASVMHTAEICEAVWEAVAQPDGGGPAFIVARHELCIDDVIQ